MIPNRQGLRGRRGEGSERIGPDRGGGAADYDGNGGGTPAPTFAAVPTDISYIPRGGDGTHLKNKAISQTHPVWDELQALVADILWESKFGIPRRNKPNSKIGSHTEHMSSESNRGPKPDRGSL